MQSIEIPRFTLDESFEVERLFDDNEVQYTKKTVSLGAGIVGGYHEYAFWVWEDQFHQAIALLKDWLGVGGEPANFTGVCPCCGVQVMSSPRCPACDLNLSGDLKEMRGGHAFFEFLKEKNLL